LGRPTGAQIRKEFFAGEPQSWPGAVDFSGIEQATDSCIDEVFGVLARDGKAAEVLALPLVGASKEVGDVIEYVLQLVRDPPPPPSKELLRRILGRAEAKWRGPTRPAPTKAGGRS
jgi:hypothetical protein